MQLRESPEREGYLWLVASDMHYQRGTWLAGLISTRCIGEYCIFAKNFTQTFENKFEYRNAPFAEKRLSGVVVLQIYITWLVSKMNW